MNDDRGDTFARLSRVVRRTFRLADNIPIQPSTTSADVDGWDSLSYSMLLIGVEAEFSIELPFDQVFALENLGELADLIETVREGLRL
jgi:acyl carrier protein